MLAIARRWQYESRWPRLQCILQGMLTTGQVTVMRNGVHGEDRLRTREGEDTHGLLREKLDS
jgi:hypothetical protein